MNNRIDIENLLDGVQERLPVDPHARDRGELAMFEIFDSLTQGNAVPGTAEILSIVKEQPRAARRPTRTVLLVAACFVLLVGVIGFSTLTSTKPTQLTVASTSTALSATDAPVLLAPGSYRADPLGEGVTFTIDTALWLDVLGTGYARLRDATSDRSVELFSEPVLAPPVLDPDDQPQASQPASSVESWIDDSTALNVQRSASPAIVDGQAVQVWTILVTPTVPCPEACEFATTNTGEVVRLSNEERNIIMRASLTDGQTLYGFHAAPQQDQSDIAVPFLDLMRSLVVEN